MTMRLEMLDFLNALQNEVQLLEVDPEASQFENDPAICEKMQATIAVLERLFPMVQAIEEVLIGEITPKLFWKKWEKIKMYFEFPDDEVDEIGTDVTGFLDQFNKDRDEGEEA